ncbi:MAG: PQQ-dependent sugar dehydrogenase [Gemmatimonadaceae bacterium]|nr:PQQ-dependent sugar dehydrogenase [Gemmatimonadaceae bacterium]
MFPTLAAVALAACSSSDAPTVPAPAAPSRVVAVAGETQPGTVNAAVAVAPAAQVLDGAGGPVRGVVVRFVVIDGGGRVTGDSVVTDSAGRATVGSWVLGPSVGTQRLAARSPGLPEAVFTATASAGQAASLVVVTETDQQVGGVNAPLSRVPAVVLRDASGRAIAGATVTFAVAEGGGRLESTTGTTDSTGTARAGRWILGSAPGRNAVTATRSGTTPATIVATAVAGGAPAVRREVVLEGLSNPWDVAFLPSGEMFFTERGGGVRVRLRDGRVIRYPAPSDFAPGGQSGMLGLALDPQFASNRFLYAFMASSLGGTTANRVVRWRVSDDFGTLEARTDIVTGIAWGNGGAHSGGRIRFGPDGALWITSGDTRTGRVPQDLQSLGGKVLRVTRDGTPAPGNPSSYPRPADARIAAWGFRNINGLAFRAGSGDAYVAEHGPDHSDEVTRVRIGGNGGWDPVCPDGIGYCGYSAGMSMTDTVKFPTALRPAFRLADSEGMGGSAFLDGPQWRDWNGVLAVATLAGRRLRLLQVAADGSSATQVAELYANVARLRGAVQGPDGFLYVFTDDGGGRDQVWRILP